MHVTFCISQGRPSCCIPNMNLSKCNTIALNEQLWHLIKILSGPHPIFHDMCPLKHKRCFRCYLCAGPQSQTHASGARAVTLLRGVQVATEPWQRDSWMTVSKEHVGRCWYDNSIGHGTCWRNEMDSNISALWKLEQFSKGLWILKSWKENSPF